MNIGIIGAGTIVPEFLKAAKLIENFNVLAISGRVSSLERMKELSKEYSIKKLYLDYDEMLDDTEIDVVYIAVPNYLHYEFARKALQKRKHTIVEKPFVSNYEQAKKLVELAQQEKVFLFEAVTNLYIPNYLKIKEHLQDIGEIKIVQLNYTQYSKRYDLFKKGTVLPVFDPKMSGGALMDLNVYNIHIILGLFGNPISITYHANIERNIDTSGILVMDYPDFKCVSIAAKDCKAPVSMNIQGDKGYLHSDVPTNVLDIIEYGRNDGEIVKYALNEITERFYYELQAFYKMYIENNMEICGVRLSQTLSVMKILDEARKQVGIKIQ